MRSSSSPSDLMEQIDRDIDQAERLIHEKVQWLIALLRRGEEASVAEQRIGEMRNALELLYSQRRKLVRAGYRDPRPRIGASQEIV